MLLYVYSSMNSTYQETAYVCLAFVIFEFLTVLKWRTVPMLNKKELDHETALVTIGYTDDDFFFDFNCCLPVLKLLQPLNNPL